MMEAINLAGSDNNQRKQHLPPISPSPSPSPLPQPSAPHATAKTPLPRSGQLALCDTPKQTKSDSDPSKSIGLRQRHSQLVAVRKPFLLVLQLGDPATFEIKLDAMAESSLTFSAILSKYAPTGGGSGAATTAPAPKRPVPSSTSASASSAAGRAPPPQPRTTAVESRPSRAPASTGVIRDRLASTSISNSASAARAGTNGSTAPKTGTNGAGIGSSTARTGDNGVKKRKLDSIADSRPATETDKQREERRRLLLEKMRQKKGNETAGTGATARTGSSAPVVRAGTMPAAKTGYAPPQKSATFSGSTGSSRPSSTMAPRDRPSAVTSGSNGSGAKVGEKKLSYKELLAKAAELHQEKKAPGIITHKPRAPVVEKKQWQKKLEARNQATNNSGLVPNRKSKSPGVLPTAEKSTLAKKPLGKDSKASLSKKSEPDSRRSSIAKGRGAMDKARPATEPVKRKRSPSPISWRGKNASAPVKKPAKSRRSRYDEDEDEDDDWIVDDDEDEGAGGYGARQRYRYAESDYESDSDMEAAGNDILEEEERARRHAIKEDIEQERLEKELNARKLATKKKLGKK
ncbi:hypothetical protein BZA05DRAFT_401988 [Tricharina praecox]|uniref:uncharacterized protein n=1 Tax=Tricharina praecox TaxID=43433 RepID=UPI002220853B|nr:uncharacterized protein BZA05DRAFT_401988 [Tricharina praecox]KAI5849013.1 hypothetical protein BZA05DRAFT_401988 [Tricharina praecox]